MLARTAAAGAAAALCLIAAPAALADTPAPGTLTLFRGRRSLHRVSPVEGERARINAVLAYGHEPGMRLNELTQRLFYGRVA